MRQSNVFDAVVFLVFLKKNGACSFSHSLTVTIKQFYLHLKLQALNSLQAVNSRYFIKGLCVCLFFCRNNDIYTGNNKPSYNICYDML